MENIQMKKDLTVEQLAIIQSEMEKRGKNKMVMYLMWWFLGAFGGHRFYLGNIGMGIGMLLTFGGLGIWALIDIFFIGKRFDELNTKLEKEIINEVKAITHG